VDTWPSSRKDERKIYKEGEMDPWTKKGTKRKEGLGKELEKRSISEGRARHEIRDCRGRAGGGKKKKKREMGGDSVSLRKAWESEAR